MNKSVAEFFGKKKKNPNYNKILLSNDQWLFVAW